MEDAATLEEIDVTLPPALLRDIDEYAVRHGYENPSAVVQEALERQQPAEVNQ